MNNLNLLVCELRIYMNYISPFMHVILYAGD